MTPVPPMGSALRRIVRRGSTACAGFAAAVAALSAGCSPRPAAPLPDEAARVATLMIGAFTSAEQAARDPEYRAVNLRVAPIWKERTDAKWVYVEQAMASSTERPYRQRVYRVSQAPDGSIESFVLALPGDPLRYAGAWRSPQPLEDLTPGLLEPLPGCVVVLRAEGASSFRGATPGTGCVSTRDGAAYTTSEVLLTPEGIESWDRGFDASGRQVWGATSGPYRFKRVSADPAAALPATAPPSSTPGAVGRPSSGASPS